MNNFTPIRYADLVAVPGFTSRFWAMIDRTEQVSDCWAWFGNRIAAGYGHVRFRTKLLLSHRVAFVLCNVVEDLPTNKLVLHSCDFRACCRPSHLRVGTYSDNNADTKSRGRGNVLCGFDHPSVKVTPELVRAIRVASGSQSEIGRRFGITQSHVSKIRLRQAWGFVQDEGDE